MEEKKFKEPHEPNHKVDKEKLDKVLGQIRSTKRFITREDFLKLLDLSDDEKKYIAERLSKSQQHLILKYLQELPESDFEIQLSRKPSMFPREEENPPRKPTWLSPLQEAHKMVVEENKELVADLSNELAPLNKKLAALQRRKSSEDMDPEYPFLSCVKRMAYAFGDVKVGSPDTYRYLHKFIEDWLKTLLGNTEITLSVELIKRMFPSECRRYFEMAKVKTTLNAYKTTLTEEKKEPDEEDLQYFSDFRSFENLVPGFGEYSEGQGKPEKAIDELESEEKVESADQGVDERQKFVVLRSENMSAEDYKEFVACRAVGLLYKGRKALCKWLNIPKELGNNKTLIELSTLIAKFALRRAIEEAIRKRSPAGMLHIISSPLTTKELEPFIAAEIKLLKDKISKIEKTQNGYRVFARDIEKYIKDGDLAITSKRGSVIISINKEALKRSETDTEQEWEKLPEKVKDAYKMRMETEKHIKAYLRNRAGKGDYVPINEYGKFVKKEIQASGVKKCNNRFFYEVFQKWLKEKRRGKPAKKQ